MRKLVGIALLLLFPAFASAETSGSYFAVIVSDAEASSEWYQSTLGLAETSRLEDEGRYKIINLHGPGLFVELLQLESATARPEGRIQGPFKVGMLVADLDAYLDSLPDGMPKPDVIRDERNKLLLIQLRDPDNFIVQIMQLLTE